MVPVRASKIPFLSSPTFDKVQKKVVLPRGFEPLLPP